MLLKRHLHKTLDIALLLFVFIVLMNRIQYGVEFSDESWHIAEPYAVAELGAVPFVNNVSQSPGFTLPLALAFKVFVWLKGSTEGIVYFSRVFYLCLHLIVSALTVWLVNRYTSFRVPLLALVALVAINHCHPLYDLNYNTIGMIYFPLIMVLVFADYGDNTRKSFYWGLLAGLLAVRTVMGTPAVIIGLVVVLLYLFYQKKKKRIMGIVAGAVGACFAIFGLLLAYWGLERLCIWLQMYSHQSYFSIGRKAADWDHIFKALIEFSEPAVLTIIILGILRFILKKYPDVFQFLLNMTIFFGVIGGALLSVRRNDFVGYPLMLYTWGMPYINYLFTYEKKYYIGKVALVCFAFLSIFFFTCFSAHSGFSWKRAYLHYIPTLLTVCLLVNGSSISKGLFRFLNRVLFVTCILAISFYGLWAGYSIVYREQPIQFLSEKVEEGIWKGLYTTEMRAKNVVALEEYIRSVTKADESVMCLDWVSFGYLMINGKMCSPSTLDIAVYSYKINSPCPYYLYFQAEKCVPDKIIYIDYGRDKHLSVDDGEWKFNELVWHHYRFAGAYRNEIFAARVYVLEDREGALRLVEKTLGQ